MIGTKLFIDSNRFYEITKAITKGDRPNANIYLCKNQDGKEFVAKHFYNGRVSPVVGYAIYNHYGRRRDGSDRVFREIQKETKQHDFLIKHYHRIMHNGRWFIILEYVKGELLSSFIHKNHEKNIDATRQAVLALAETLKTWHSNGFALGDPHLDNAIAEHTPNGVSVRLIDYSLIHHRDFHYCKSFKCFESDKYNRFEEDLRNTLPLGKGFLNGLENLELQLGIDNELSQMFLNHYNEFKINIKRL